MTEPGDDLDPGHAPGDHPAGPAPGGALSKLGTPGVCRVCGADARTPRAFYCEDHTPAHIRAKKKRGTGRPPGRPRKSAEPAAAAEPAMVSTSDLGAAVEAIYLMAGKLWGMGHPGSPAAAAIEAQAADCAQAWEQLAARNPRVRRGLEVMTTGGGWAALVVVHVPIVQAFTAERAGIPLDVIEAPPAPPPGIVVPEWGDLPPAEQAEWLELDAAMRAGLVAQGTVPASWPTDAAPAAEPAAEPAA